MLNSYYSLFVCYNYIWFGDYHTTPSWPAMCDAEWTSSSILSDVSSPRSSLSLSSVVINDTRVSDVYSQQWSILQHSCKQWLYWAGSLSTRAILIRLRGTGEVNNSICEKYFSPVYCPKLQNPRVTPIYYIRGPELDSTKSKYHHPVIRKLHISYFITPTLTP